MPAGTHTVTVFPDQSAGDWSDPVAGNPYFSAGLAGWLAGPFATPLVWSNGKVTGYPSRDPAAPCLTPQAARTYRVRLTVTIARDAIVYVNLNFGYTAQDAYAGPFWNPDTSRNIWAAWRLPAGTHTLATTWDAPSWQDQYGYIGPALVAQLPDGSGTNLPAADFVVDSLVLDYQTAEGVDISCLVDTVTINHGRDDSSSQPEAASATLDFTVTALDPLPSMVEVGAVLIVTTVGFAEGGAVSSQRLVGRITDMSLGWDDAGPDTPDNGIGQLVAVSLLADLGRRVVGAEPWPQQLDGARIGAIMAAAGVELDPEWSDPGTVDVLPRDVDSQPALELAQQVAQDAGGILWHTRDGDIRYADAEHRRGIAPALELDACDILVTPTWRRNTEGLVNRVSIGYGVAPPDGDDGEGGGEQPRVIVSSPASIARYGEYFYTAGTQLATAADAAELANLLMVRNNTPVWIMAALPVDVANLSDEDYLALLALDVHSLVILTGLPAIGTAPTSAALWVEGWKETLAFGVHDVELVISGYCRTAPPPRWDDLNPTWTWDTLPAGITWDSITCLGPQPAGGRWTDVPASLRWDQIPPATTWDTWGTGPEPAPDPLEMELTHA